LKIINHDNSSSNQGINAEPPKYTPRVLTREPRHSTPLVTAVFYLVVADLQSRRLVCLCVCVTQNEHSNRRYVQSLEQPSASCKIEVQVR